MYLGEPMMKPCRFNLGWDAFGPMLLVPAQHLINLVLNEVGWAIFMNEAVGPRWVIG